MLLLINNYKIQAINQASKIYINETYSFKICLKAKEELLNQKQYT